MEIEDGAVQRLALHELEGDPGARRRPDDLAPQVREYGREFLGDHEFVLDDENAKPPQFSSWIALSHVPTGSKLAEQRIEPMIASAGGPVNARPLRHLPCRDRGSRHIVNVERAKRFPPHRPHTLESASC
jgi:hypothetical protein